MEKSETCFASFRRGRVVASCGCLGSRQLDLFGPVPIIVPCWGALKKGIDKWQLQVDAEEYVADPADV